MHPAAFLAARTPRDERAAAVADLSGQRHSDPPAFRARVAWWARTLADAAWAHVDGCTALTLTLDADMPARWALADAGQPQCIAVAAAEMARAGRLVRLDAAPRTLAQRAAAAAHALLALAGLVEADGDGGADGDGDGGAFDDAYWPRMCGTWIVVANVERAAAAFERAHPPAQVLTRAMFDRVLDALGVGLCGADYGVLTAHLARAGHIAVAGDVVKIGRGARITRADHGLLAVRVLHDDLERQLADLDARIGEADAHVRSALGARRRDEAHARLRLRRQLEDVRARRVGALETAASVLVRIEQAMGDREVVAAYAESEQTLRGLLADPALRPDAVERTLDGLRDAVDEQGEVHAALAGAGASAGAGEGAGDADDELARELEALSLEAQQDVRLPDAPRHELREAEPEVEAEPEPEPEPEAA